MSRFIRFVTPERDTNSRSYTGIFSADWSVLTGGDWRFDALMSEYSWFNRNLDIPVRLELRQGRKGNRSGVCWFRPEAFEFIRRARYMSWLLTELGLFVTELRSADPGTRLWADEHQIVALPDLRR